MHRFDVEVSLVVHENMQLSRVVVSLWGLGAFHQLAKIKLAHWTSNSLRKEVLLTLMTTTCVLCQLRLAPTKTTTMIPLFQLSFCAGQGGSKLNGYENNGSRQVH